jgi:hypothetical protein
MSMTSQRFGSRAGGLTTRAGAALAAALIAVGMTSAARAQLNLAYSFELDTDGFGPNGGGITVTQDTIGATEGTMSLKIDVVQGATFVGALTSFLASEIADPPGLDKVVFDLTITEAFAGEGFVRAGITIFGASQPDYPDGQLFGLQAQFQASEFDIDGLAPGTYPVEMLLDRATHPLTFATDQSFNDIFGEIGSGVNDLSPSGFQIYINKSNTAPWVGYVDNVRLMPTPVLDADFNDDNVVDGLDLGRWKTAFSLTAAGDADGDLDSDGEDFLIWQRQLATPGGGISAVPEPAAAALAGMFALALVRRRTAVASLVQQAMRGIRE